MGLYTFLYENLLYRLYGEFSAKRDMSSRSGRLYSGRQGGGPLGPKSSLADDTDDSPSPGGCAYIQFNYV